MRRQICLNQRLGLGFGLILLGLGVWLYWMHSPHQIQSKIISISRSAEKTLVGRLYLPPQTQPPYPTVMLWHGVSCTKEVMEPLAIELARQGVAAFAVDAGGFGESYDRPYNEAENVADASAIAAYVHRHPDQFDATRIAIGGHSMGGATALALANEDSRISTTIVLGMSADINPILPPNLLMGVGVYEQFHTPHAMRSMLQQGAGEPAQASHLYGEFAKGTARKLVISPTSDHLMEPFDPTLIQETVDWIKHAFSLNTLTLSLITPGLIMSQFLIFWGSGISLSYLLHDYRYARTRPKLVTIGFLTIGLLILGLNMAGLLAPRLTTDLILILAIALPLSQYAITYPLHLTAFYRITGLYALVVIVAYTIVAIVLRCDELITHPAAILGLPQFMLHMPIALFYSRLLEVRAALFPVYSTAIVPGWTLLVLFLPELIKPGIVLHIIRAGAIWVARWLRQPWQITQWRERPTGRSVLVLAGLIVVLVGVLYQQAQSGILSLESAQTAIHIVVQMALLPGLLIIGMMRSAFLQKIEKWCLTA